MKEVYIQTDGSDAEKKAAVSQLESMGYVSNKEWNEEVKDNPYCNCLVGEEDGTYSWMEDGEGDNMGYELLTFK